MLSVRHIISRHLSERELLAACLGGRESVHLRSCADCRARHADLMSFLEARRADATDSADEVFGSERLAAQEAQILRRLENLARPVRVLAFPQAHRVAPVVNRVARKWVALAAAAGLVIGLAAGLAVDFHPFGSEFARRDVFDRVAGERGTVPVAPRRSALDLEHLTSDEVFLGELESALGTPRVEALAALDALTPRVIEAAVTAR